MGGTDIYEPLKFITEKYLIDFSFIPKNPYLEEINYQENQKDSEDEDEGMTLNGRGSGINIMSGKEAPIEDKNDQKKNLDQLQKRIFILTDGEVDNPDQVIQLARVNADRIKIHTFGLGSDCSKYLVEKVAKAGRGTASFVDENSNDLKGKVINALKKA